MTQRLTIALVSIFSFMALAVSPALAAKNSPSATPLGNDISWPQCGKTLPSGQAFGIVGINDGLANTTNPCLAGELSWAQTSTGSLNLQAKAQVYVNTANPGGLGVADWPANNVDSQGNTSPNPYGTCDGSDSLACAWQYGWDRAVDDVNLRLAPASSSPASSYPWWLDVETGNSWESGSAAALQRNTADLSGMFYYLNSVGANVGIYSTSYQWGKIVGTNNPGGNLNGVNSWLPGARNQKAAKSNCSLAPLTVGGTVTTTQFVSGGLDYDYSCI